MNTTGNARSSLAGARGLRAGKTLKHYRQKTFRDAGSVILKINPVAFCRRVQPNIEPPARFAIAQRVFHQYRKDLPETQRIGVQRRRRCGMDNHADACRVSLRLQPGGALAQQFIKAYRFTFEDQLPCIGERQKMQLIRQTVQQLKLLHHHRQLLRIGRKNAVQHPLQAAHRGGKRRAQLMGHCHVGGAQLFFIPRELAGHGIEITRKTHHFRRRFPDQLRLTTEFALRHLFCRLPQLTELSRQRAGIFQTHKNDKWDHDQHQHAKQEPVAGSNGGRGVIQPPPGIHDVMKTRRIGLRVIHQPEKFVTQRGRHPVQIPVILHREAQPHADGDNDNCPDGERNYAPADPAPERLMMVIHGWRNR
ncbi:hypothetical protein BN128_3828 [Cronobacter sakazakii 696]|nr:hypothetical protein BN128_3828 [Cronobacter sakazakii 696]